MQNLIASSRKNRNDKGKKPNDLKKLVRTLSVKLRKRLMPRLKS